MVYWIIAVVALALLAGLLGWRVWALRRALQHAEARRRELQKERAIRQNLQRACDNRDAELKRLRERVEDYEDQFRELEDRTSDLNMTLFHESGRRILAEKEEGAKRLKMEQLETQLDQARERCRAAEAAAAQREAELRAVIDQQEKEISRLRTANARRLARRTAPDASNAGQVTLEDILGES